MTVNLMDSYLNLSQKKNFLIIHNVYIFIHYINTWILCSILYIHSYIHCNIYYIVYYCITLSLFFPVIIDFIIIAILLWLKKIISN